MTDREIFELGREYVDLVRLRGLVDEADRLTCELGLSDLPPGEVRDHCKARSRELYLRFYTQGDDAGEAK